MIASYTDIDKRANDLFICNVQYYTTKIFDE